MAEYTYKELMKMQNDAIRRAEEMKNRAQRQAGLDSRNKHPKENTSVPVDQPKRIPMNGDYLKRDTPHDLREEVSEAYEMKNKNTFLDTIKNGFNDLSSDPDRALILSIVLLLAEENADQALIIALLYML